MESRDNFKNKSVLISLTVAVSCLLVWGFSQLVLGQEALNLSAGKYQSSLNKTRDLIKNFPKELFNHPFLKKAEAVIKLPLEVGVLGNPNLFKLPEPPEKKLLQNLLNR